MTVPLNPIAAIRPMLDNTGQPMSEQEYLDSEPDANIKREYIDGKAYAMAGATFNHARIVSNLARIVGNHLQGSRCEVFTNDIRVKTGACYFYPDIVVDCGRAGGASQFADSPLLIAEVLSSSTRRLDATVKLLRYLNLPMLEHYLMIESDHVSVQVFSRQLQWRPVYYFIGDQVRLDALELECLVETIYDRVDNHDMNLFRTSISRSEF